jgi:hypothetical protein
LAVLNPSIANFSTASTHLSQYLLFMALQPSGSSGLSVGTITLIVFMIGFTVLGYSVFFSICLGILAGFVSGFISAWWNAKEDYTTPDPRPVSPIMPRMDDMLPTKTSLMPYKMRPGFGVRHTPRKRRRRPTQAQRRFGWLFRKDKKQ